MRIFDADVTGSLNVSGSSNLKGGLVVSGSQTVTGSLTAHGNVKLGDQLTDTHTVTGSLNVTGSISGSLTGALRTDYVDFNTGSAIVGGVARLTWNADERTLDLGMGGGNSTLQLGQELYYPPIFNGDSINLVNGTLVMVDPLDVSHGDRLNVIRAVSDGSVPSKLFVGVLTEDVDTNQIGLATFFGLVRALSVPTLEANNLKDPNQTWFEGTLLYADPTRPGGLTSDEPTAPHLKVTVAAVTRQYGNNVDIMVRPDLNKFLGELNDMNFTSITESNLIVRSGSQWVNSNTLSGSYVISGSLDVVGTQTINGNQIISGSITITQNINVLGTSSFTYITSSNLNLTGPYIYTNIFEPIERFGGLVVFDSGSDSHLATASLLWDSERNHWIYQNASGSSYSGGMLLSGPRNTGSLGDEVGLTSTRIPKSVGGDHLDNSNIYDTGTLVKIVSNSEITGSLKVTGGIQGLIDYNYVTNVPAFITGYTETQTLQDVTDLGSVTSNDITANSFIVIGGGSDQFLKADGTLDGNTYLTQHPTIIAASSSNNSGRTYIQDILLDSNGHVTGITTASESVVNVDTYLTGATFNTGNGIITLTKNDGNTVTVDIDGRFLTSYTETQTLQDVTDLGSTTTNDVTARSFIVTGANASQFLKGDGSLDGTTYLTSASLNGYATTGYVSTQISNLIDSAPGTLDTLNELAAAINDDPNFYGTITGITAGKVSKSGDTMTGDLNIYKNNTTLTLGELNVSTGFTTIQMYGGDGSAFNGYAIRYNRAGLLDQLEFIDGGGTARIYFENGGILNASVIKKIGGTSSQFLKADGSVDTNTYLTQHPSVSAASSSDNSGRTYIQDILLDQYGHITGITTATETLVNTDYYTTGATFNTGDGVVTFTRNDGNTYTVDLDGRFLTAHPSVTAASSSNNSGRTYIQDILLDSFGHITGITTATETVVDTNDFINNVQLIGSTLRFTASGGGAFTGDIDLSSFLDDTNNFTTGATFNTSDGVVTFTRNNGNTYTVDLDGRYLTSFSETDTLATVTARGNTTNTSITVSGLTSNNDVTISGGTLTVYESVSGATVFAVDGTNGRLFAVTDDLSNSLFSVNTISGLPVIEAFADYHVVMGRFNQNDFYIGTTGEIGMGTTPVTGYKLAVNGNLRATSFVKTGGTSAQFLKADGSVDSNTYLTQHPTIVAASSSNNSGRTYIQDILLDSNGHITGITTATETVVDTDTITRVGTSGNEVTGTVTFAGGGVTTVTQVGSTVTISTAAGANTYLTGATFNTSDGVITLTKNDGNTVTVDIDGRFLTAESDTLATVTARGASTTTAVSFNGGLTTTGFTNNSNAILADNTGINPSSFANKVVAGAITSTSGWGITTGIGGNAGTNHNWGLGHNGSNFYMGISNGSSNLSTFLEVSPARVIKLNSYTTNGFVKFTASDGTISVDTNTYLTQHPSVSAASSSDNSGRTYIQDILLDQYGHITGITTATETVVNTDTNYYTTGATFNTGDGVITGTLNNGSTWTVDIDGRFSALGHTHDDRYLPYEVTDDNVRNTGWYTIAVNPGNRATGKFILRDTSSGNHQSTVFYATHHFGNYSDITVLINSFYSGSPFRHIRILDGGTYDGALLQVYVDLDNAQVQAWLLEDVQNQGWIIKDWVPDGVDPGDTTNFAALTTTPAQVDLDNNATGGIITTGNIYGGGDTTQYLYLNTNNYPTTLDTRYYTETEIGNFFGGTTAITGYNKTNWDTAFGWGNHGVQGYATTGYVATQISNLIDSAPGTLDTLNELAAAINDDPNFYSTITGITNNKVSKSGDTMTGNLTFGATSGLGVFWGMNTDSAFIKFVSTGNGTGGSYLEIGTTDDLNEEIKFSQSGTVRFLLATDGFLKTGGGVKYVYESGTWGIDISGNSATVTNGVYTTGTYSNPAWITTLAGSKVTGNISGNASNITSYTINQNLGTGDTPTFSVVRASRFEATTSSTRNKLSLWGTDTNYTIGMESGVSFGGLNDYAMTFQFNNEDDRGFWWGDASHSTAQGAMALTTNGYLTVARGFRVGYGESDTTTPSVPLQVYGSGSLVFDVQGSQGQLFSVTDNLSGSLFSVNDISGLPILEVNSDDSVTMGRFNQNDFVLDTNGNMGMGATPVSGTKLKVSGNVNATKVSVGSANYSYDFYNNGTSYFNGTVTLDDYMVLSDSGYFVGSSTYGFRFNNAANNLNNMTLTNSAGNLYVRGAIYVGGDGATTGDVVATQAWVGAQGFITGYSNFFTTGATFNTSNGIITFTRNNGDTFTVDIDGKYAEASHTHSYLPLAGGTMTGNVAFNTTGTGLSWTMNTDGAYIMFYNTGDGDTNSRLEYGTSDNGDEFHRWMVASVEEMTLKSDGLRVVDSIYMGGNLVATQSWVTAQGYTTNTGTVTSVSGTGTVNGLTLSGTVTSSGNITLGGSVSISVIDNVTDEERLFNNMGQNHSTQTDFNSITNFGARFVQGSTNGPGTGAAQFYGFSLGLGNDYAFASYAMQIAFPRWESTSDRYISMRTRENTTWSSWQKIYAGYADSAGSVAWTNVSGRPTALSIFTNDSGYITSSGSISGNAATATLASTVTINYNNDSNSTYQMLWGSGNSVYGTAGVYLNPWNDYVYATSFNASDWFRSSGATGWYNSTHGGGIYQTESTMVRVYDNRGFWIDGGNSNTVQDATLYVTATNNNDWLAVFNAYNSSKSEYGVYVRIASGASYGYALMTDGSTWTYRVDGSGRVYAPSYYDINDTAYYLNPASTSNLATVKLNSTADGTEVFTVDGVNGRLFTITDDLSDSLFSVSTIAGVPVIEAFSDYRVVMGRYNQNDFVITSGGNTGLGTASPSYKLHVLGSIYANGGYFRTSGTGGLYWESYDTLIFSENSGYIKTRSDEGIILQNRSGTQKGYIYFDSSGFGLLNYNGSWWLNNVGGSDTMLVIGGYNGYNAHSSVTGRRLLFGGADADAQSNYYIGTNLENYGGNYNKLDLRWHTGIRMGAQASYGGIRFYNNEDLDSVIFSVGQDDANVRVTNNLYMGGNLVATQSWVSSQGYLTSYSETDPYRVTAVAVTGTTTKTITITRADSSTVTTTWTDYDSDSNTYLTGATFNTGDGVITMTKNDGNTVTVDIDGRYLTGESDTLATVTSRGSSTTSAITIGGSLTINKSGTNSDIIFPAETNDPGFIRHYESSNAARMYFSVSDDDNSTDDYFQFGAGGTYRTTIYTNGRMDLTDIYLTGGGWFRAYGTSGLYSQDYGNHWYATDNATWNSAGNNTSYNQIAMRTGGHQGSIRGFFYADSSSNIGILNSGGNWALRVIGGGNNVQVYGQLTVGSGTSSDIYMTDTDETTRRIHCNSSRIGFLNSSDNWSAYSDNTGNWITPFAMYASDWFRTYGTTGWYSETYAGGIHMTDTTWVRVYNNKQFLVENLIQSNTAVYAPTFYDSVDNNYYLNPNGASNLKTVTFNSSGANAEVLAVNGVNGRLFTVTDDMTDSIFSVNTISGLPVIEAFADYTVIMGRYGQNDFKINGVDGAVTIRGNTVWHAGNDGSGSGLDADLLDGQHGSYYYPASNPNSYISGNQTISLSGDVSGSGTTSISVTVNNIDGVSFVNTANNSATAADSINSNGISYVGSNISLLGQTDGALYSQAYSADWQHQIYGDYRTGQIVVRGKSSGTWQSWRTVVDSSNIGSYAWTSSNDGSGSGLDADLWDGNQFSSYLNQAVLTSSNVTFNTVAASEFYGAKFGILDGPIDCYMYVTDQNPTEDGINYGGEFFFYGDQSVGASILYFGGGSVTNNFVVGGRITENSSIRYKKNIEQIENGLEKVLQLSGVTYTKIETGKDEVGVIAEEVAKVLPEAVGFDTEGRPDSVSYGRLTAILIEAIKDLKKEIDDLKGTNNAG